MRLGMTLPIGAGALATGETARWSDLRAMAQAAEAVGFERLFVPDHLLFRQSPPGNHIQVDMPADNSRGVWEAWTMLAALAEATDRIHLGTMVACCSYRNPALFAKMADTLDEISGGRLILGLGSGWHEPEYKAFGFPYDHRVARFEEALQIIVPLLRTGAVDFEGQYYRARDCELLPRGPRPEGLPILIGAIRPRMMRLAAQYADIYDADYLLETAEVRERFDNQVEACNKAGRNPKSLQFTAGLRLMLDTARSPAGEPTRNGFAIFEMDGMRQEVRLGDADSLIEHIRGFAAAGVDYLTLSMPRPDGVAGIEAMAPIIEAIHADS